jgi:hypothetical protein
VASGSPGAVGWVVSGETLEVSLRLWSALKGPKPPAGFECNGCTLSPDTLPGGLKLWPACVLHDYAYSPARPLGGTWASRRRADVIFRRNLYLCARIQGKSRLRATYVSATYFRAVRLFGGSLFPFEEAEKPRGWWSSLRERFGAFKAVDGALTPAPASPA